MSRYRLINTSLNREYRNDLNHNFGQISDDIDATKKEIKRVEVEADKAIDDIVGGGFIESLEVARDNANTSAVNANEKASYANAQGNHAKTQGDYAKVQGDYAKSKGDYADDKAILADTAADNANQEASNLDSLKVAVVDATQKANASSAAADLSATNADTATTKAMSATAEATDATQIADDAADNANTKADLAQTRIDELSTLDAEINIAIDNAETATSNAQNVVDIASPLLHDVEQATVDAIQATTDAETATSEAITATDSAIDSTTNADVATSLATLAASNADEKSSLAQTAAENADAATLDAVTATADTISATSNADVATSNANQSVSNADEKAVIAQTAADNADAKALLANEMQGYAKVQGDYAKSQGDAVQDVFDEGLVASVNSRTGAVVGLAEEVEVADRLAEKVDKVAGKQLSTEDYTTSEKGKLSGIDDEITSKVDASERAANAYTDEQFSLIPDVYLTPLATKEELDNESDARTAHENKQIHQGEIHGMRIFEEEFQYFDGSEWVELKGGGGSGIKVGNVSDLTVEALAGLNIKVAWKDPLDVEIDGIPFAKWSGTQLRRKEGNYPLDEKDGTLIVDSKVRDQYATGYSDSGLVEGTKYFYSLFPYTESGDYTYDPSNRAEAIAVSKFTQSAPIKPTVSGVLLNKATVKSDVGSVVSLDKVDWHASPHEFIDLVTDDDYTPYAKFEETGTLYESPTATGDLFTATYKTEQVPPSAPITSGIDFDRVTINGGSGTEVRLGDGSWHDSPHAFTGLTPETSYTAYARKKETSTHYASEISSGTVFSTPAEADDYSGSPGPDKLIAGTMQAGYFGTVPASELWTGTQLSAAVGISAGTIQHDATDWLKFAYKGKVLFRPMKPIRHTISWDQINAAGCVSGTKTVVKNGLTFNVRLMKGALTDPSLYDAPDRGAKGSEWNRLMLPIHEQAADKSWAYPAYVEDDIPNWGSGFTDADLLTHNTHGNGSYQWCQEVRNTSSATRVIRGYNGVSYSNSRTASSAGAVCGWAPVLELSSL